MKRKHLPLIGTALFALLVINNMLKDAKACENTDQQCKKQLVYNQFTQDLKDYQSKNHHEPTEQERREMFHKRWMGYANNK